MAGLHKFMNSGGRYVTHRNVDPHAVIRGAMWAWALNRAA